MASDDSVYLHLAASLTEENEDFNTSDDEPLCWQKKKTTFTESDDEPLSKCQTGFDTSDEETLQQKISREDHDDTHADPTYVPSDTEEQRPVPKGKKAGRKRRIELTELESDPQLEQVKEASLADHMTYQKSVTDHKSRLDNFLSANGLYRQEITPDGNCFFQAAATHLDDINHLELRSCLCDYLEDNFTEYIHFMVNKSEEDENDRYLRYFFNANELRLPGRWVNDAADLLPRALSDFTARTVVIYSSDVYKSQHEIHPSAGRQRGTTAIPLAFIDCDPTHYDACHPLPRKTADLAGNMK